MKTYALLSTLTCALFGVTATSPTNAQDASNPYCFRIENDPASFDHFLKWESDNVTTFFIQQSLDLESWSLTQNYYVGDGSPKNHLVSPTSNKSFYRLLTTPTNLANPHDTDGDGLDNAYEFGTSSTNPLDEDTDGDGTNDGDEVNGGTNPNDNLSFPPHNLSFPPHDPSCPYLDPKSQPLTWSYIPIDLSQFVPGFVQGDTFSTLFTSKVQLLDKDGSALLVHQPQTGGRYFYLWTGGQMLRLPDNGRFYSLNRNGYLLFRGGTSNTASWRLYNINDPVFQSDLIANPGSFPANADYSSIKSYEASYANVEGLQYFYSDSYLSATFNYSTTTQTNSRLILHDDNTVTGVITLSVTAFLKSFPYSQTTAGTFFTYANWDFDYGSITAPAIPILGEDSLIATEDPYGNTLREDPNLTINLGRSLGLSQNYWHYQYRNETTNLDHNVVTTGNAVVSALDLAQYEYPFDELTADGYLPTHTIADATQAPPLLKQAQLLQLAGGAITPNQPDPCQYTTNSQKDLTSSQLSVGSSTDSSGNTIAALWSTASQIDPANSSAAPTNIWTQVDLNLLSQLSPTLHPNLVRLYNALSVEDLTDTANPVELTSPPIILAQGITDQNKTHPVLLLPIELRMRQDVGHIGPYGSAAMYETPRPNNGDVKGELFSLWLGEQGYLTIGGALGDLVDQGVLPVNAVKWSGPDLPPIFDNREYPVEWQNIGMVNKTGLKTVTLEVSGKLFKIRVNVPDVGVRGRTHPGLILEVGLVNLGVVWQKGNDVLDAVQLAYGMTPGTGGTRQDAIRHSTWNAVCTQFIGQSDTIAATTANEYHGRTNANGFSSNSTMDLQNNWTGSATYVGVDRTIPQWITELEAVYDLGFLFTWRPENNNVNNHHHMMRDSRGEKLFND